MINRKNDQQKKQKDISIISIIIIISNTHAL